MVKPIPTVSTSTLIKRIAVVFVVYVAFPVTVWGCVIAAVVL
jgi:hypothetical protein